MVDCRAVRLIHRSHELLAQLERMRAEARAQRRVEWLRQARDRAARVAERNASSKPRENDEGQTPPGEGTRSID